MQGASAGIQHKEYNVATFTATTLKHKDARKQRGQLSTASTISITKMILCKTSEQ